MTTNIRDASREQWSKEIYTERSPSDNELVLGATLRIADALERIADLLDPEVRKRRKEERHSKKKFNRKFDNWSRARRDLTKMLTPLGNDTPTKAALRTLAERLANPYFVDGEPPPLPALEDIDPRSVKLGPKTRMRVMAAFNDIPRSQDTPCTA